MTDAQQKIIDMVNQGARNCEIEKVTGLNRSYICKVRKYLMVDPNHFKNEAANRKFKLYNGYTHKIKPRTPVADHSGMTDCLREGPRCLGKFFSEDKRYYKKCDPCRNGCRDGESE